MTTTGIVFFAYNTTEIDYVKLSTIAARYAKRYMPGHEICLITDAGTWEWSKTSSHWQYAEQAFDEIVLVDPDIRVNQRTHYDSPYHKFTSEFKNGNKHKVFQYTPYDKTLLLDIDYIVQNDSLAYVFDTDNAVTLFQSAESLIGEPPALPQQHLHDYGIPMLWSTAIYFDKTQSLTKLFFETWEHISKNYDFYKFHYGFPGKMYRTDYCVSIATHMLNGMGHGDLIDKFPTSMINMSQHDDIVSINTVDEWGYLVNDRQENWKDTLTLIQKENVHVMNKRALDRNFDDIMAALELDNR